MCRTKLQIRANSLDMPPLSHLLKRAGTARLQVGQAFPAALKTGGGRCES
jgi:hypothetical protein